MDKHNRVNLSCTVPKKTKDKLNKIALYEDQTVSRLAAQAISVFVKEKERQNHPALSTPQILTTVSLNTVDALPDNSN